MEDYKDILIRALKDGLYLLVKYGLLIAFIIYGFNFSMQTRQAAVNGEQAALAIVKFQQKGYLPQFVNGDIPQKVESVK